MSRLVKMNVRGRTHVWLNVPMHDSLRVDILYQFMWLVIMNYNFVRDKSSYPNGAAKLKN